MSSPGKPFVPSKSWCNCPFSFGSVLTHYTFCKYDNIAAPTKLCRLCVRKNDTLSSPRPHPQKDSHSSRQFLKFFRSYTDWYWTKDEHKKFFKIHFCAKPVGLPPENQNRALTTSRGDLKPPALGSFIFGAPKSHHAEGGHVTAHTQVATSP